MCIGLVTAHWHWCSRLSRVFDRAAATDAGEGKHVPSLFGLRRASSLSAASTRCVCSSRLGVLTPKIVLPADATVTGRGERHSTWCSAHEIAHVTRGDWLVQMVAEVCKAIYWFNPLFWIVRARLRHESERACDDAVMSHRHQRIATYASELLELARSFGRHRQAWLPAPRMAARPVKP